MSNPLAALVAYGDSDSDSDEGSSSVKATPPTKKGLVNYGLQDADEDEDAEGGGSSDTTLKQERPGPMDTVSSHATPPLGPPSTGTSSTTTATTTTTTEASVGNKVVAERLISKSDSRASSPSTPLPPDHSAAADVANTPTAGRSPRIQHPSEATAIDEEQHVHPGSHREALRRQLLKPKPIEGVENFGIPPEPEGECSPELQSLVQLVELDETGSNFDKSIEFFDFKGYPQECFAAGLAAAQDKAQERLAMQQQAGTRTHLQFVHGSSSVGSQAAAGSGITTQHQAALAAATGAAAKLAASYSHASHASGTAGGAPVAGRSGRKSKWDTGGPTTTISSTTNDHTHKKPRH
ncbi:hypothetical protein BGW42_000460 [Actinomortierella wolfii]|nr:hypothetical protein BGW42_000460 [Actinomortierella wolfii]